MYFKKLTINEWQQFANVEILFHDRLTIVTGANGSGKTTILNLLARHYGWDTPSLATPRKDSKTGIIKFLSRLFDGINKSDIPTIGKLEYTNNTVADLKVQNTNNAQYQVQIAKQQNVKCLYIPSHRSIYRYQALSNIPTAKRNKNNAFQQISSSVKQRYLNGSEQRPSSFYIKNILIGWIIQGYGVKSTQKTIMAADGEQIQNFEEFQNVLRTILPKSLGFEEIEVRNMEVVFVCNGGRDEFILETASGGISALIDMAWQIYIYSTKENENCTVMIDEVENHLHPTMQRQILTDLLKAFPNTNFIVSTHSPLVVGSVKDSAIYALAYNEANKIESRRLDFNKKARTASEILDEVLGVSVTMPLWAEEKLNDIVGKFIDKGAKPDELHQIRTELEEAGLEKLMPSAISAVLGREK